jgi:thymidylate kinase
MIILLNGAFGIGKTTVARSLVARLPRATLFDPELVGMALQRGARLLGRGVEDFQDLASWRRLTVAGIRAARALRPNIVVPMAFSNATYLREIRLRISRFEPRLFHFCLIAPVEVVHERLRGRGEDRERSAWQYRRASECCITHASEDFATHVDADRTPDDIAQEILRCIDQATMTR